MLLPFSVCSTIPLQHMFISTCATIAQSTVYEGCASPPCAMAGAKAARCSDGRRAAAAAAAAAAGCERSLPTSDAAEVLWETLALMATESTADTLLGAASAPLPGTGAAGTLRPLPPAPPGELDFLNVRGLHTRLQETGGKERCVMTTKRRGSAYDSALLP